MNGNIIPFQLPLVPTLPTIEGNVDYRNFRDQLLRINDILIYGGIENQLIHDDLQRFLAEHPDVSAKAQQNRQIHCRRALRCNIARTLLNEDYRGFATRLADSPLLQHFCAVSSIDCVTVPAKSTLHRYAEWFPEQQIRELVYRVFETGFLQPQTLNLEQPLDLELYFLDTTCLEANIHYPVDWVLLRDATTTLMKAVRLIRDQELKHRMEPPEEFMRRMNGLCIEMTHAGTKPDSQRHRKRIFRKIDKLTGTVRSHAQRYRKLLDECWEQTEWTRAKAEQVLRNIDHVLELLPKAREQARQRILHDQQVPSKDKLLSLYETEARVIVRRKAGKEVEFGNTLLIGETGQGLILDWKLFEESAPNDVRLLIPSLDRVKEAMDIQPRSAGTDRGFDSEANQAELQKRKIYNAMCPRSPKELKRRCRSWKFNQLQQRRSQTEGRIGIIKNNFLGHPLRSKGFKNRELSVTWAVLTHNLWVIARLPQAETAEAAA